MPNADLELSIRRRGETAVADARFTSAGHDTMAADVPVTLDYAALRAVRPDPEAYGRRLAANLFAEPRLRSVWQQARTVALQSGALRLRLRLDSADPELHAVAWELLRDPEDDAPLALSERVRLSRYLESADFSPLAIPLRPELRALIAIASPANLAAFGFAEIDVEGEVTRARSALGEVPTTIVGGHTDAAHPRATLAALTTALRDGPQLVLLVCHGSVIDDEPYLWLEGEDRSAERVPGTTFVQAISHLSTRPLLLILASCQSGGRGYGDALAALGPRLARAGTTGVLAFQGDLSMGTARKLLPTLLAELRRDGSIDRALAAARGAIRQQPDWWRPVLWLRTRDGQLWHLHPPPAPPETVDPQVRISTVDITQVERTLRDTLPFGSRAQAASLAPLLTNLANGSISKQEAQERLATDPILNNLLRELVGQRIDVGKKVISFGKDNQIGDVRIGAVASGSIITINININVEGGHPYAHGRDVLKLPIAESARQQKSIDTIMSLIDSAQFSEALVYLTGLGKRTETQGEVAFLAARLAEMGTIPGEIRLEAGRIAGENRDPRFPVSPEEWERELSSLSTSTVQNVWDKTPPRYWCYLPEGTRQIGGWVKGERGADIYLPGFWIARLPITVEQYAAWLHEGGELPEFWGGVFTQAPNAPVVGALWSRAIAYCAWLTNKLARTLPKGYIIRLPTEAEWEVAAAYDIHGNRHTYPWGETEPTADHAVFRASRRTYQATVGCCPAGAAFCGALDMMGNVWEVMLSSYENYPTTSHRLRTSPLDESLVWRGGCWSSDSLYIRCASRVTIDQKNRYNVAGFRVVLARQIY